MIEHVVGAPQFELKEMACIWQRRKFSRLGECRSLEMSDLSCHIVSVSSMKVLLGVLPVRRCPRVMSTLRHSPTACAAC